MYTCGQGELGRKKQQTPFPLEEDVEKEKRNSERTFQELSVAVPIRLRGSALRKERY